ncbi:MAG: hypothetical protein KC417_07600, partial [Myxococcales bacterium]|nr:hypothetical protein [Myxococcales bacterium]
MSKDSRSLAAVVDSTGVVTALWAQQTFEEYSVRASPPVVRRGSPSDRPRPCMRAGAERRAAYSVAVA